MLFFCRSIIIHVCVYRYILVSILPRLVEVQHERLQLEAEQVMKRKQEEEEERIKMEEERIWKEAHEGLHQELEDSIRREFESRMQQEIKKIEEQVYIIACTVELMPLHQELYHNYGLFPTLHMQFSKV